MNGNPAPRRTEEGLRVAAPHEARGRGTTHRVHSPTNSLCLCILDLSKNDQNTELEANENCGLWDSVCRQFGDIKMVGR